VTIYDRTRTLLVVVAVTLSATAAMAQSLYSGGQNIAPSYDGWYENADGSFTLIFGYFSRNLDEIVDIPVGPNNSVEPGGPDQGQPARFFPRRNRYVFRVTVPKDFGKKEIVWTLTARGKTEKAYATLKPEYVIDHKIMMLDGGSVGRLLGNEDQNKPPVVTLEGESRRTVAVGVPLVLSAVATDDGIPNRKGGSREPVVWGGGLRVAWYVHRASGEVTLDPEQLRVYPDRKLSSPFEPRRGIPVPPPDGRSSVKATFSAPGTYVLRVMAHDGGLATSENVTVTVVPAKSAPPAPSR
jgi:hypothetical protein